MSAPLETFRNPPVSETGNLEITPFDVAPIPTGDDLADVVGNNAYFRNLVVASGIPTGYPFNITNPSSSSERLSIYQGTGNSGNAWFLDTIGAQGGALPRPLSVFSNWQSVNNSAQIYIGTNPTSFAPSVWFDVLGTGTPANFVIQSIPSFLVLDGTPGIQFRSSGTVRFILNGTSFYVNNPNCTLGTGGKAGAAIDGDVSNPTDGMLRYDSTNNRLYIRIGGTWRYATLT